MPFIAKRLVALALMTSMAAGHSRVIHAALEAEEAARASAQARLPPTKCSAIHEGHGLFDDFADLFTATSRAKLPIAKRLRLELELRRTIRFDLNTFMFLAREVGPAIGEDKSKGHVPTFVAFTALYHLATGGTYGEVARTIRQGISEATVMRHVRTFTSAVVGALSDYIRFPNTRSGFDECSRSMESRSGIPGIIGALDGTHIRIHPNQNTSGSFINYKGYASVILLAVVDPRGFFMFTESGFCGKNHDSGALKDSLLWTIHDRLFSNAGYCIYGDAAFPLKRWLLTGFRNRDKTEEQIKFNRQGSRARVIVEWYVHF